MALPHMQPTYSARPYDFFESQIVTRRNRENNFREMWSNTSDYFSKKNTEANKKAEWESHRSFESSMDAYKALQEKDARLLDLQKRRKRLAALLADERDQLHAELKELTTDQYGLLTTRRAECDRLRTAREEERKQFADEKLYEHWRYNNPDIRQLESQRQQQHVVDNWTMQRQLRREREEQERLERESAAREVEEQRQRAIEAQMRREEEKREEARQLKESLERQMDELKERESEAKRLKDEEEMLAKEKRELAAIEEERKAQEKERAKVEFRQVLLRQHAAALRRRSKQIQQDLEADQRLLERLAEQEAQDQHIQSARREKARADAAWMKQVIEDQIRMEKAREAELDMLYQDEAARIWQQRESEWERERLAREQLMQEVMRSRQEQIEGKMDEVRRQQEDSLERREQLLEELELVNQMTRREQQETEAKKVAQKEQLKAQMSARRELKADEDMQLRLDLEEEQRAEADYEEMLKKEAERMSVRDYQPKSHQRQQAWM